MKGFCLFATLLHMLKVKPGTVQEIAQATGCSKNTIWSIVPAMHSMGRAHIKEWRTPYRCRPLPVYAAGPGEDAPVPASFVNGIGRKVRRGPTAGRTPSGIKSINLMAFFDVLDSLSVGATVYEAAEECGVWRETVRKVAEHMRSLKMVYIQDWQRTANGRGMYLPVYALGNKPDAKKPPRQTNAETARRYYYASRKRVDPQKAQALAANASIFSVARRVLLDVKDEAA